MLPRLRGCEGGSLSISMSRSGNGNDAKGLVMAAMLTPADEMKQREDFSLDLCSGVAKRLWSMPTSHTGAWTKWLADNCLSQNARLVCQDPHDERSRGDHQHEGGRSDAFEIADTQMRHDRTHKVDDEANAARDP